MGLEAQCWFNPYSGLEVVTVCSSALSIETNNVEGGL